MLGVSAALDVRMRVVVRIRAVVSRVGGGQEH